MTTLLKVFLKCIVEFLNFTVFFTSNFPSRFTNTSSIYLFLMVTIIA